MIGIHDSQDVLLQLWGTLPERDRQILEYRLYDVTLAQLGADLGLTRERIRQIENQGKAKWHTIVSVVMPSLATDISQHSRDLGAISVEEVMRCANSSTLEGCAVFLQTLGYKKFRIWGRTVERWWVLGESELGRLLAELVTEAPFSDTDLSVLCEAYNLPPNLPIRTLLKFAHSPLALDSHRCWIRKRSRNADSVYLWLSKKASPASADEIAAALGLDSVRALGETLRRDRDRFVQIRPEGTWAITDWNSIEGVSYRNATEAMLSVLQEDGPLSLNQLLVLTQRRYPVTEWRIQQCLYSVDVGLTKDGRYDLISRGAMPITRGAPRQPRNMQVSGDTVAVRLKVSADVLRGSGIAVSGWLAWTLGLNYFPAQIDFYCGDVGNSDTITIRRNGSGASISSLRSVTAQYGLSLGCEIVLVMDRATMTAKVRHVCRSSCPRGDSQA